MIEPVLSTETVLKEALRDTLRRPDRWDYYAPATPSVIEVMREMQAAREAARRQFRA